MMVRTEALAWAISQLPPPDDRAPRHLVIPVPKHRQLATHQHPGDEMAVAFQRLLFHREVFARDSERWQEWVLDVAEIA